MIANYTKNSNQVNDVVQLLYSQQFFCYDIKYFKMVTEYND